MERNIQKIGVINLTVLFLVGLVGFVLAKYSESLAGQVGAVFFGIGFLVALISYFQMRLEDREVLEKLEFDELTKEKNAASLFNTEAEAFPAQHARQQFERFFLPGFAIVLFLIEAGSAYFLWNWLQESGATRLKEPMAALSMFAVAALVLFVLGKYSANLARLEKQRLLRPGASFLVLGFYLATGVAVCIGLVYGSYLKADLYMARVETVILGLIATETLISLILEIYRPRVKGKVERLVYESRLVGLLGQPEGLVTTLAQALDYQFGFKVSETWFYKFLEKALAWLILVQFGLLFLSTTIVFIGPGEQGLIERFGSPIAGKPVLDPGPHLKMPWPIDQVYRYRTQEIQSFNVGFVPSTNAAPEKTIIWTVSHYKDEFNLLVASREQGAANTNKGTSDQTVPADLLTVSIPVQYQISDLKSWAYNHMDAGSLLEKLATREVIRYLVGVDLFEIMSSGRAKASLDLQNLIQARSDELKLGVKILFVGLQDIHPPVKVAASFEAVIGTRQENEAKIRMAEGYAARVVPMAGAEAQAKVREAEAYRIRKVTSAAAKASQFTNQVAGFNASPEVFMQRSYLAALDRGTTNTRKFVLTTTNTHNVIMLNLEEKIAPTILDIPVPTKK